MGRKVYPKVYTDHDGTYLYAVAATNLKAAAKLLRTTVGSIRRYGGIHTRIECPQVADRPGVVFRRDMTRPGSGWEPESHTVPPGDRP